MARKKDSKSTLQAMRKLVVEVGICQGHWWDHLMTKVYKRHLGMTKPTDKSESD